MIEAAHKSAERRIVLFPYGQPIAAYHRERCSELVVACGGDPERVIDAPTAGLVRFMSYIEKIRVLRDGSETPLIVFTRTNPLALTVLNARRQMEHQLPVLSCATWGVYVAPEDDPFFMDSVPALGCLDGGLEHAPIWTLFDHSLYLVLSPNIRDLDTLRAQVREIDIAQQERSGARPILHR